MSVEQSSKGQRLDLQVRSIGDEATDIKVFELADPDGKPLPDFTAGAHIDVFIDQDLVRQYSLSNDPRERQRYRIGVLREQVGQGGSHAMHDKVREGQVLQVSAPRNNFALHEEAERHLLLAGGIGVTPMISMVARLQETGADFTLHYCTKSRDHTAFLADLAEFIEPGKVVLHHDGGDPSQGLDIKALLAEHRPRTHLYYCGPTGFMRAAEEGSTHWPKGTVHFEYFSVDPEHLESGDVDQAAAAESFEVEIASSGQVLEVPADKSIVQVLWENGFDVETSCESGLCGTCITRYTGGEVDHRDMVLDDEEHEEFITVCCSRAKSKRLVLDL